jgi:hypothetical protein
MCIAFAAIYLSNFNNFCIITTTLLLILPQIYNNYAVGRKLKKGNIKNFLCFTLPRYAYIVNPP